jgi:hypothetical protein
MNTVCVRLWVAVALSPLSGPGVRPRKYWDVDRVREVDTDCYCPMDFFVDITRSFDSAFVERCYSIFSNSIS